MLAFSSMQSVPSLSPSSMQKVWVGVLMWVTIDLLDTFNSFSNRSSIVSRVDAS